MFRGFRRGRGARLAVQIRNRGCAQYFTSPLIFAFRYTFQDNRNCLETFANFKEQKVRLNCYIICKLLFKLFSLKGNCFGDFKNEESNFHYICSVSGFFRSEVLSNCNRHQCIHDFFDEKTDYTVIFSVEIREHKDVETTFYVVLNIYKADICVASVIVMKFTVECL